MSGSSTAAAGSMIQPGGINVFDTTLAQQSTFFQGDFQSDGIVRDPLITGFAFVKWLNVPNWVTAAYPGFQAITEKNLRNFGGISDIEISAAAIQEGFTASENNFAGSIQRFQGFTMSHREYSGSPIRNSYTYWVTGIRDPATGIARYPKVAGVEYSAANHTGELIYIMTRPDADNTSDANIIEFSCLYTMVMPSKVPLSHLNFQAGSNEPAAEIEQSFFGVPHISAQVDAVAVTQIANVYPFVTMGDFAPATSNATGDSGSAGGLT
jgi:hypothetical protein